MTDRHMTGEERAIEDAREYVARWDAAYKARGYVEPTTIRFARALLSTSAAVRGMREALEKAEDALARAGYGRATSTETMQAARAARAARLAVLSGIETEQEQARSPSALSAPTTDCN